MINPNDPAYPEFKVHETNGTWINTTVGGLTKREYFAAMAMQGLLPGPQLHITNYVGDNMPKEYAVVAVAMADALIAELNKEVTR